MADGSALELTPRQIHNWLRNLDRFADGNRGDGILRVRSGLAMRAGGKFTDTPAFMW